MPISKPLSSANQDTLHEYLANVFSAFRLGAWRHDQTRAEIEATMARALQGDAALYDHMEKVIAALSPELGRRFGDFEPPEDQPPPASHPVNQPKTSLERRSFDLARQADAGGVASTTLHLYDDGSIRIERFDHGPASEAALGGDFHHSAEVPAGYTAAIAFILLSEQMRGRLDAVSWLDQFCTRWGIPCRERRAG